MTLQDRADILIDNDIISEEKLEKLIEAYGLSQTLIDRIVRKHTDYANWDELFEESLS